MLGLGEAKSLRKIAAREGIDNGCVSRMVNLTTLVPDIVVAVLEDALSNSITLFDLAMSIRRHHLWLADPLALYGVENARLDLFEIHLRRLRGQACRAHEGRPGRRRGPRRISRRQRVLGAQGGPLVASAGPCQAARDRHPDR
ncbi:protein of unknown function [Methylococcus capsulatus]|uniref:Uncharacterized protein n=1 Tax=Methylococcus capsulatus TaxID=414 RepID=A0AA35XTY2_METCP|nr:protein of unknown function [Methylococcus capsulatus]